MIWRTFFWKLQRSKKNRRKNLNSWKVVLHFLTERVKNVRILYINATLALLKYVKKNSCIIFFNLIFPSKHQFYRTLFAIQFRLLRTFFANKPMASTNSWAFIYARARNIDAYVRRIFFFLWVFFWERWGPNTESVLLQKHCGWKSQKMSHLTFEKKTGPKILVLHSNFGAKIQIFFSASRILWDIFQLFSNNVQKGSNC